MRKRGRCPSEHNGVPAAANAQSRNCDTLHTLFSVAENGKYQKQKSFSRFDLFSMQRKITNLCTHSTWGTTKSASLLARNLLPVCLTILPVCICFLHDPNFLLRSSTNVYLCHLANNIHTVPGKSWPCILSRRIECYTWERASAWEFCVFRGNQSLCKASVDSCIFLVEQKQTSRSLETQGIQNSRYQGTPVDHEELSEEHNDTACAQQHLCRA